MARRTRAADDGATLFPFAAPREPDFAPRVLAGIDEAGFGPMLGPLTIGCVALRSADGAVDPWERLASVVSRAHERDADRLCVGDSKAVFERNERGRARLERTVLAFHALVHGIPVDGRAFLAATPPPLACADLAQEFWHASIERRLEPAPPRAEIAGDPACSAPVATGGPDVADALEPLCAALGLALAAARLEIATCAVRAVPAHVLNASFERTGSKGATHWEQCTPMLLHVWNELATDVVDLVVDRHGGRMRYAALLEATLPGATVTTVSEIVERSIYRVRDPSGRDARITFAEKADALSFQVALASCCAKYARELCMDAFNAHFARLQPGLEPTAGYTTDARRWLGDAGPALERAGIAARALVRTR